MSNTASSIPKVFNHAAFEHLQTTTSIRYQTAWAYALGSQIAQGVFGCRLEPRPVTNRQNNTNQIIVQIIQIREKMKMIDVL